MIRLEEPTIDNSIELKLQKKIELLDSLVKSHHQTIKEQNKNIEMLCLINERLVKENGQLKDEIRRLKELKTKPKFRSSKMDKDNDDDTDGPSGKRAGSEKRDKTDKLVIHKREIIKANDIPEGSKFKGYKEYVVQGLEIKPCNLLFQLERWQLPDGTYKIAELPEDIKGHHFSTELRAYILYQHHHQGVTQPLLLAQLREWGIDISSGQLNRILIENKAMFHEEKQGILKAGLAVSKYIQVDDTGARHNGKNGYCTHIGNELFAFFESTESKSRINFLELLRQEKTDYLINEHALAYMERYKLAPKYREKLSQGAREFLNKEIFEQHLIEVGLKTKHQFRIATEGALIGGILHHGFRVDCAIISDDAGQFNIFQHALCWIHAERKINELIPHGGNAIKAFTETRSKFWALYDALKGYKLTPNESLRREIEKQFDELFMTKTCYHGLNIVLKRLMLNKKELLLVLDRPEIPLHNNLSERDIREYVKKRKISGSTRSEEGRKCRDTFTSLKKTCKKLGVKFWDYLIDRTSGKDIVPALSILIEKKAMAAI